MIGTYLELLIRAHIVTQMQIAIDGSLEKTGAIGTTKRGIGPSYATKMLRKGLRVGDLLKWESFEKKYLELHKQLKEYFHFEDYDIAKELSELKNTQKTLIERKMVIDNVDYLNKAIKMKKHILIEGANATMLDVDHGTYPYVTSSSTNIGGACTGLGIPPDKIDTRIGVVKAYLTRVGGGPFPSELTDKTGEYLQTVGQEYGATTGRKRRCGWQDLNIVRYAHKINNFSSLIMTKLDVLSQLPEIKVAVAYRINNEIVTDRIPSTIEELEQAECVYQSLAGWMCDISNIKTFKDLPPQARNYVKFIETSLSIPVSWIGVGAERDKIIKRK